DDQVPEICVAKARKIRWRDAVRGRGIGENGRVRASGHGNRRKCVRNGKQIVESTRHRPNTGATREHKRTVDVEKDDGGHVRKSIVSPGLRTLWWSALANQPSVRTFPARGPLADGSSSKLTRWPSLN